MRKFLLIGFVLLLGLPVAADEGDAARFETVLKYLTESSRSAPTRQSLYAAAGTALARQSLVDHATVIGELLKAQDGGALQAKVLESMLKSLNDPWAKLYTPEESRAMRERLDGDGQAALGVSIVRSHTPAYYAVIDVAPKGPADGHLYRGDKVLAANGYGAQSEEFSKQISGEAGETIKLTVESEDGVRRSEVLTFADYDSKTAYVVDREAGIIRISSFGEHTSAELREALKEIGNQPVIIDLRFNGGGYVNAAVDAAELFLDRGDKIVTTVGTQEKVTHQADEGASFHAPVCILVNRKTASAAEIFTAALHNHVSAYVVGETTYGKGSVQRFVELPGQWAIKYTTSLYQTPDGVFIDKVGLKPDRAVDMRSSLMSSSLDTQLAEAKNWSKTAAVATVRSQSKGRES